MRRRRRPRRTTVGAVLGAAAVGLIAVALTSGWFRPGGDDRAPEADPALAPERPAAAEVLIVDHVFDGDTIRATTAESGSVRIRLIGVDTPEGTPTVECGADAARSHLAELLPPGSRVWAAADVEAHDHYGRELRYLWNEDGTFVNLDLVVAGHAEALRVAPNVSHAELFADAETAARNDGRGRWGRC